MTTRPFPFRAASRWTALAAAAVALLFAASLPAAEPEYTSLAGVKAKGFQKWLDDAKDQGYEIYQVMGYEVGDHAEYAGVAIKDPAKREFEAKYDMTADEMKDWIHDMKEKSWRLTVLSGYRSTAGPRFAVVLVKDKKPYKYAWDFSYGQTDKEFEKEVAKQHAAGLELKGPTAYQGVDGTPRFASLFMEPSSVSQKGPVEHRINLTEKQLQEQLDKWKEKGFRLWGEFAYDTPDGLRFLAVGRKVSADDSWETLERHGLVGNDYQKEFDAMAEKGFRPVGIYGYFQDGQRRFAAAWVKKKD